MPPLVHWLVGSARFNKGNIMSTTMERSVSSQDSETAEEVLHCCKDWFNAVFEVEDAIKNGGNPATTPSIVIPPAGRIVLSTLEVLRLAAVVLSRSAGVPYRSFDTEPLWKAFVLAAAWSQGEQSEERASTLFALFRSIECRVLDLQAAAARDLNPIKESYPAAQPESANEAIDRYFYEERFKGTPDKNILPNATKEHPEWCLDITIQGMRKCAEKYREKKNLSPIPPRKTHTPKD